MTRYVAFLRAVNVGGRTVKMDELRRLFEDMNLSGVQTFIASGNVIFESGRRADVLEKQIEAHLRKTLGYEVKTFVRSIPELRRVARYEPFEDAGRKAHALYVAFLAKRPGTAARKKLMAFDSDVDDLHVDGREVYWRSHRTMRESNFSGALLERTLDQPATLRNVTTVRKIATKYARDGEARA